MLNPQAVSLGRDTQGEVLWLQFMGGKSDGSRGEGSGVGVLSQEALVQETSPALEQSRVPQMSSCPKAPDETQGSGVVGSRGCGEEGEGCSGGTQCGEPVSDIVGN